MEGHLKKPKIAVGGIEHETAGFLPGETPLEDFLNSRVVAKDLLQRSGTSNTVVDGYISGIKKRMGVSATCLVQSSIWCTSFY